MSKSLVYKIPDPASPIKVSSDSTGADVQVKPVTMDLLYPRESATASSLPPTPVVMASTVMPPPVHPPAVTSADSTKILPVMNFCPKCGKKREDDHVFCPDCGYKLSK